MFGWKALEFGAKKLYNVELVSIMALSAKRPTPVEVRREGSRWSVLSSAAVDYTKTWPPQVGERQSKIAMLFVRLSDVLVQYNRLHCKGHLCMTQEAEDVRTGRDIAEISSRLKPLDMKGSLLSTYEGFAITITNTSLRLLRRVPHLRRLRPFISTSTLR